MAMLNAAKLPPSLWGEAVLTAVYLWNCTESVSLPPGVTPFEMVNGRKPDLLHIRVFGSRCWARIPTELQTKLGPHTRCGIFMGYPEGVKGYRVRDAISKVFFVARDIEFDENVPGFRSSTDSDSKDNKEVSTPKSSPSSSPTTPTETNTIKF